MDRDLEQFGSLGFIGIYRESFRLIFKWKRIFTQITLSLILPLCILSLAHSVFSELFFGKNRTDTNLGDYRDISVSISSWVFKVIYFFLVLFLSLLSTAAVVYTIACIYTSKDSTFRTVMRVTPKVWSRLLVTFLWSFLIYFVFSVVSLLLFVVWESFLKTSVFGIIFIIVWLICFIVAYFYIAIICQLAYVVSVLEDDYGRKAIAKGRVLVKGKYSTAVACYLVLLVALIGVELVFELFVSSIDGGDLGIGLRILIGVASLAVIVLLYLLELVYQTVIYFVCKSYHNENIDRSSLAHHLEGYARIKDVQLESVNNV